LTTSNINVGKETAKGTFWIYLTNYSGQFLVFVSTIILARLLSQEAYGVVGYAVITINLLNVLSDLGIGPALIYHRDEPHAADTAFWLSILFGVGLYIVAWFTAPLAALYFQDERAIAVIRVLALTFPIQAFDNVHDHLLKKSLAFKRKFIPEISRAMAKGTVSVALALAGSGAWSLVVGQLAGRVMGVISYWRILAWRPAWQFNPRIARSMIGYGLSIVMLNAIAILMTNIDYLIVGRILGTAALGIYTLAFRIPDLVITDFCNSMASVLFPVYVKIRDDAESLANAFLNVLKYVSAITLPMGVGLILIARSFVLTFLTDKWIEAIPVIQAIAVYSMLFSLSYNTGSFYKAKGKVRIMTWLSLFRLALTVPLVYWAAAVMNSIAAVGWVQAVVALITSLLNLFVAGKIIKVPFLKILSSIRPSALSAIVMAAVVVPVNLATNSAHSLIQLVLDIILGGSVYLAMMFWLQRPMVMQAVEYLKKAYKRIPVKVPGN